MVHLGPPQTVIQLVEEIQLRHVVVHGLIKFTLQIISVVIQIRVLEIFRTRQYPGVPLQQNHVLTSVKLVIHTLEYKIGKSYTNRKVLCSLKTVLLIPKAINAFVEILMVHMVRLQIVIRHAVEILLKLAAVLGLILFIKHHVQFTVNNFLTNSLVICSEQNSIEIQKIFHVKCQRYFFEYIDMNDD